jgi:formate hydrogenlyase subunit 6/NADH:ubiquinone oxidoreductase subunit I
VKACDLKGFVVQDFVFSNHDFPDPFYIRAREENLIISADCTDVLETCFCIALGIKPYPQANFDINLSLVRDGFLAESGSQKGEKLFSVHAHLFNKVSDVFEKDRYEKRKEIVKAVEKNIQDKEIPLQERYKGIIEKNYKSDIWQDESKTCVECGACNSVCPTCHCFLLYDQADESRMARFRMWDSCMIKDFARVAGGANPRSKLWMRLRNRFEKKFDFFPKVADVYACTGCGRCVSACPGKIDIRKVLKRLAVNA